MTEETIGQEPQRLELVQRQEVYQKLFSWTIPAVEVAAIVKPEASNKMAPLNKEEWIIPITRVARLRAEAQNLDGVKLGYYPEGFIVDGVYTYSSQEDKKKKKTRKHIPQYKTSGEVLQKVFPTTFGASHFAEVILGKRSAMTGEDINSMIEWARLGNKLFRDENLHSERRIEMELGVPVFVFSGVEDMANFRPYRNVNLPENTQAASLIVPTGNGHEGFPIVVCHESCSAEDRRQHVRTLLEFAQSVDPREASPVLVSRFTPTLEDYLEMKVKERILQAIIVQKTPLLTGWFRMESFRQLSRSVRRDLFRRNLKGNTQSPFFIEDWPDIRKTYGISYQTQIGTAVENRMNELLTTVGSIPTVILAREIQLAYANIFSLYQDWDEASQLLNSWDHRHIYRRSFGIPSTKEAK